MSDQTDHSADKNDDGGNYDNKVAVPIEIRIAVLVAITETTSVEQISVVYCLTNLGRGVQIFYLMAGVLLLISILSTAGWWHNALERVIVVVLKGIVAVVLARMMLRALRTAVAVFISIELRRQF